jgi:hypothetical protein
MRIVRPALLLLLLLVSVFGVEDDLVVRGPVALMAAGPQTAHINTTLASLVALDDVLFEYCDLSHAPTSHNSTRTKIRGSVVMVGYGEDRAFVNGCSLERAYVNLVEAGALATLLHSHTTAAVAPGYFTGTIGGDMLANLEATKSRVPMLEISDKSRNDLIGALIGRLIEIETTARNGNGDQPRDQQAARLIIESSENIWPALFNSSSWFVVMRRVMPSAHFLVVAASFYVLLQQASRGEFVWGSTSCWVVFIEMVPALALGVTSICGLYEGAFFSREVQYIFKPGFLLSELVSTILVARYWYAQAEAAKVGFEHARAVDPQQSWKSVAFTVAALGLDVANAFFRDWNLAAYSYASITLLATIVCALMFIHATFKMLRAARAPDSTRRISVYILTSVLCMVAQVSVIIVLSTAAPLSPNQVLIFASVLHLTRSGTGLCQLFVFLPCTLGKIHPSNSNEITEAIGSPSASVERSATWPGRVSIDTRLLAGESSIVRALKENTNRLEQENARLLETQQLEEANNRLQQEQAARLELKNKAKVAENKRLKNDRAADSSMNHTVKVHTRQCTRSMLSFTAVISSDSVY